MKIVVDTEASGPCPMYGDVISIGAVIVEPGLSRVFRSPNMRPIFDKYNEGAYASIGMTREEHLASPATIIEGFELFNDWLVKNQEGDERMTLLSDNPAFDWQWINFGFHHAMGRNPLGHSARRIGDMWAGLKGRENDHSSWKRLRKTRHSHDPLDDAMGNAEAYLAIWDQGRKWTPPRAN